VIGLWWLAALAAGAPEDALNPVLARLYSEAREDESAGRYGEAATGYAVVARGDPLFRPATLDLGRALERAGRLDEALAAYASRPDDVDALDARVRLLLDIGDLELAHSLIDDLAALGPSRPGWRVHEARILAKSDPVAALERLSGYLEFYGQSVDDPGFEPAWRSILEGLRDAGDASVARTHLDQWIAEFPDAGATPELIRARRDLDIERAARALAASGSDRLDPPQVQKLADARAAFRGHELARSAELLEDLIAECPRSAAAWVTLSDVRAAQGDPTGSIEALDAALEIAPLDADALVRRGDRLIEGFGGRLDEEAVDAYRRASDRRPNDVTIWIKKARAERRTGRWRQARASYQRVVELEPEGPLAIEAQAALAAVERPLPAPRSPLPPRGRPPGVSEAAWTAYFRAWAWREHRSDVAGGAEEAEARAWEEVRRARRLAPDFAPAMNLEATLLADRGEVDRAVELLWTSVNHDRGQAETWLTLAQRLEDRGDPRHVEAYDRAADLGHPAALWRRARHHADRGRWWKARDTLAAYFAATTHGPHHRDALALDDQLDRRIRLLLALGVLGGGLAIGVPLGIRLGRRAGVGLDVLIDVAPREWPAIARTLSAIRHEVLKHHTSVLPSVAKALDRGEDAEARWVADRLYGPSGALARLDRYLEALRAIGRSHDTRLNLRFQDPDLGALIEAAARLRRLEPELREPRSGDGPPTRCGRWWRSCTIASTPPSAGGSPGSPPCD